MIKIAKLLEQYRSVILVILFFPIISLFLSNNFHVHMLPENPHRQFKVSFKVPARTATEILNKVIKPTEKIFNGLPGIISIESSTQNEQGEINLRFNSELSKNSAYLNIQEKMDRIRLMLPSDVESYNVEFVKQERPANIQIISKSEISLTELKELFDPILAKLEKTEPSLDVISKIQVAPIPQALAKNKISISQVVLALRSLGLSTAIGRKNGVMFETGNSFASFQEIQSALIGSTGDRPIRLIDVAEINTLPSPAVKNFKVWIDTSRITESETVKRIHSKFPNVSILHPYHESVIQQSFQPILLIVVSFFLQILVIYFLKLPIKTLFFFGALEAIVSIHFLFWHGLLSPPITVLDLHALAYTLFIGSIFLAILYVRIRSFFVENSHIKRPPKTLEQAKLFALSELMPTFITLYLALWIISMPLLSTNLNLPSRFIAESLFTSALPILLITLVVLLLSTSGSFLYKNISYPSMNFKWSFSPRVAKWTMWSIIGLTLSSILIFTHFYIGVSNSHNETSYTQNLVENLRGYNDKLIYKNLSLSETELKDAGFSYIKNNLFIPVQNIEFSPSGMRFLPDLDLAAFANSLKDLQSEISFGSLDENKQDIPIVFSAKNIQFDDISNLIINKKMAPTLSKSLGTISDVSIVSFPSLILRDNMIDGGHIVKDSSIYNSSFSKQTAQGIQPTPWSKYLLEQYSDFQYSHLISFLFLFLLFAIYLNSFIRSSLVLIFVLATTGLIYLLRTIWPFAFHADSLWLLYSGTFMALFQILVLTRIIDIERSRGIDRDLCVKEVRQFIAPGVFLCSTTFILALALAGVSEFLTFIPSLGFWQESFFIAITTGLILLASGYLLFPLFYLVSEETIDNFMFKIYRRLRHWKRL